MNKNLLREKLIRTITSHGINIVQQDEVINALTESDLLIIKQKVKLEVKKINFINAIKKREVILVNKAQIEKIMNALNEHEFNKLIAALPHATKLILRLVPNSKHRSGKTKNSIRAISTPMGNRTR